MRADGAGPRNRNAAPDSSGQALLVVAGGLVTLLGMAALAVDFGLFLTARSEAQRAADAAALAGAGVLVASGGDADAARTAAISTSMLNPVRGLAVAPDPADVDVLPDSQKVRVRVARTDGRGNAVATLFARVVGFGTVDVGGEAAAQAFAATAVPCILPLALPDRWRESDGTLADQDARFDSADGDLYLPWDPSDPARPFTGYSTADRGTRLRLKPGTPGGAHQSGWFFAFRIPGSGGGSDFSGNISGCADPGLLWEIGMEVTTEPGNMQGPTRAGFQDLILADPGARWDTGCGCVTGSAFASSPRIRPVALFDPSAPPASGSSTFRITNFLGVFVEELQGGDVWVRLLETSGVGSADSWVPVPGPLAYTLRIVE